MSDPGFPRAMGWLRDYPDFRDHTVDHEFVSPKLAAAGQTDSIKAMRTKLNLAAPPRNLPASVDLRAWCSPVEDQGQLGSCTANAGAGLVEYFEMRAFGQYTDASRLFLYKATRDLLKQTGDSGAYIRTTIGAIVLFGLPPESYWPYKIADFDKEPSAFLYAFAQNYKAITYYRLDPAGTAPAALLAAIKANLAAGLPAEFGFTVYSSIRQADARGAIPFPAPGEGIEGGHAIDAVGYDDSIKIKNGNKGGIETTGAFLIRNSWGSGWGDKGYGWLPYEYVLKGLAVDWWSILKNEWVNTKQFGL